VLAKSANGITGRGVDGVRQQDQAAEEKRRRAAAVRDAGAFTGRPSLTRSIVECASPLALLNDGTANCFNTL
jgi:hypothetical protein